MKLHFKPFPGLTIVTVISLAILIALGTWQFQRLQWKTNLLAEIDAVADAPPFTSFSDIQSALDAGSPIDFRRYGGANHIVRTSPRFLVFTSENADVSWKIFTPVENTGVLAFATAGIVNDAERDSLAEAAQTAPSSKETLAGYVRLARPDKRPATDSTPEKNRWFGFNPLPDTQSWADGVEGNPDMRFYIDVVAGALDANALPARRPDIRNNHFDYMLTWYGLAIVLLVIYLILHRRAGRLRFS